VIKSKEKIKGFKQPFSKKKIVTTINWAIKDGVDINARSGVYFLHNSRNKTFIADGGQLSAP